MMISPKNTNAGIPGFRCISPSNRFGHFPPITGSVRSALPQSPQNMALIGLI